jgi:hypothetical protein
MKSSRFGIAVVGVALVGLWYAGGGTGTLPAARADGLPQVERPVAHANLSVYFLRGPDAVPDARIMTLEEALATGRAVVHETGNVNVLAVENLSADTELFVQSGDIVKGGKQDRVAATDVLLPPRGGVVPLPAHCVEQGRWTNRGGERVEAFTSSNGTIAGKELKYANASGVQSAVWDNVKKNQEKLNDNLKAQVNAAVSPTSFQLTLEAPALRAKVTEYEAALRAAGEGRSDIVGAVFVVNGQITGAEVYGSNALFRKAWPKLLNSAAVEAVADLTTKPTPSAPCVQEVERFLVLAAQPGANNNNEGRPARNPGANDYELFVENVTDARGRTAGNRAPNGPGQVLITGRGNIGETRTGQVIIGGSVNSDADRVGNLRVDGQTITGDRVQLETPDVQALQNPAQMSRRVFNFSAGPFGSPDNVAPGVQPVGQTPGNRLESTKCENEQSLMVESRDAGRGNSVLRRSYIAK